MVDETPESSDAKKDLKLLESFAPRPAPARRKRRPRGGPNGRPPHAPTPELRRVVANLTRMGLSHELTAKALGIARWTLRRHYRDELSRGGLVVAAAIATTYVSKMLGGTGTKRDPYDWRKASVPCLIWYTKSRLGWTDQQDGGTP